jgi:excisionase family DNA binding protein
VTHRSQKNQNTFIPTGVTVPSNEPLLIDIRSAATLISSPVSTIRRLIKSGHLHYIRCWGKKFLIDPQDIRNLIAQNKIKGAA